VEAAVTDGYPDDRLGGERALFEWLKSAGQIEQLLAEERFTDAVEMARATVEMLQYAVCRAAEGDSKLADLSGQLNRIRHNLDTFDVAG
jgi:hypothetical protein